MTTQITSARPAAGPRKESRRRPPASSATKVGRPGFAWALPARGVLRPLAIVPLIMVAVLSFMSWDGISPPEFVGTDNWSRLIDDPVMLKSIWLTLLLTALGVVLQTPLSILLGVWAAGHQRNRAVLSVIYFIPLLLSATAVSVLWRALLDLNFGIPADATWLFGDGNLFGEQATAIGVLAFVSTWQFTPFHTLIYQGAARAVPQVLYQAAEIDGAGRYRQVSSTSPSPQLRTSMVTSMILMIVGGLTTFETILILTQGGPGTDTTISAYYMYDKAFKSFDYGTGSAIALGPGRRGHDHLADRRPGSPATTRCAVPRRVCHEAPTELAWPARAR